MSVLNSMKDNLEKILLPLTAKITENKTMKALQSGMMLTMPISLGVSIIAILSNLPFPGWIDFLRQIGIYGIAQEVVSSTISMLAIYITFAISYNYAKNEKENAVIVALIAVASFITMMPQSIQMGETSVSALLSSYLGSEGIFVSMIVAVVTAKAYCWLSKKNLRIKLPDSVPPMVSDSLGSVVVAMIWFTVILIVKYAFSLTSYGNIFAFISQVVSKPVMSVGTTVWALIFVQTFANLMFFFGIHPSAVFAVYSPIMRVATTANAEAFMAGEALPYLGFAIAYLCIKNSGTGNTLGLSLCTLFAKSERFKSMRKLVIIPNLFNINEPIIYGFPVMLNPIFFIPMMLSAIVPGAIAVGFAGIFNNIIMNTTIRLPWVTPTFITAFTQGGLAIAGLVIFVTLVGLLLYYPFFKIADSMALKEEQQFSEAKLND